MACFSHFRAGLFSLGLAGLFGGCGPPECAEDIELWIDEAPAALEEFLAVREEVLADTAFIREQHGRARLFLMARDTAGYPKSRLPKLTAWFRHGRSHIDISAQSTSFCFRECVAGHYSAYGSVYFLRKQHDYKLGVEVLDSLSLGNGWYAHVRTCRGCDE